MYCMCSCGQNLSLWFKGQDFQYSFSAINVTDLFFCHWLKQWRHEKKTPGTEKRKEKKKTDMHREKIYAPASYTIEFSCTI